VELFERSVALLFSALAAEARSTVARHRASALALSSSQALSTEMLALASSGWR
jgi:hypothetical protein